MPTMNDAFPSKYLNAESFDTDMTVTIKVVKLETLKGREGKPDEDKYIAYFNEMEKGLVLNKTNFASIAKLTEQEDSDNWVGKKITLTIAEVPSFGEIVKAIRVKEARSGDPLVQKYWKTVADMQLTTQEGRDHLKEFRGDFEKALAGLLGEDNDPTPSADQLPPKK